LVKGAADRAVAYSPCPGSTHISSEGDRIMFLELFVTKGSLTEDQRQTIGRRLITELMAAPGAPDEVVERARANADVVFHETASWITGGGALDPQTSPRYVVRMTAPGGHLSDGMRSRIVERITRVLAEAEDDPERLYREQRLWIHILELPDRSIGSLGRTLSTDNLIDMVMKPETGAPAGPAEADTVIDPICGMTVVLDDEAITLDLDGTVYGFCHHRCRDMFAEQKGITVP
jgi:YHS domain-containing protein